MAAGSGWTGMSAMHIHAPRRLNGSNWLGIAPENVAKIYDPFYTTKGVGRGTGLGLAVSYGIVQEHSGHISVESSPGRGTKFRISLPTAQARVPLQAVGD